MLTFEPNIVVIDDKKDEIQGVLDWYNSNGIGCKYYDADIVKGDVWPDSPYSDVNLIFLDLHFSSGKVDHELCANWIQSIIPEKSFYVLVIWTKDPAEAEEVLDELKKINRLPFVNLLKNKSEFPSHSEYKYDFTKLFQEIDVQLENTPSLAEIGVWKKSTKRASNVVIGGLSKNSQPEFFISKLQKIIVGHGGTSMFESTDSNHKRSILFDALDQILVSNTKNSIPDDKIHKVNDEQLYILPKDISSEIDKELNSWFHFKMEAVSPELIVPGLICENNHSLFQNLYSIQDDNKLVKRFVNQIDNAVIITDIVLVMTRPCDIAQSKYGKNIKLISGVALKNPYRIAKGKKNGDLDFDGNMPDSTKIYDHLQLNKKDNDVALVFDFRYVFSVPEKIFIEKFKNIKVFNKELLSEMQVEYSSYSSRLGITQII